MLANGCMLDYSWRYRTEGVLVKSYKIDFAGYRMVLLIGTAVTLLEIMKMENLKWLVLLRDLQTSHFHSQTRAGYHNPPSLPSSTTAQPQNQTKYLLPRPSYLKATVPARSRPQLECDSIKPTRGRTVQERVAQWKRISWCNFRILIYPSFFISIQSCCYLYLQPRYSC